MENLLRVKDIQERYGCAKETARRYMYQMRHMVNPLRVTESALEEWEQGRMREPMGKEEPKAKPERRVKVLPKPDGKFLIPRKRPAI